MISPPGGRVQTNSGTSPVTAIRANLAAPKAPARRCPQDTGRGRRSWILRALSGPEVSALPGQGQFERKDLLGLYLRLVS